MFAHIIFTYTVLVYEAQHASSAMHKLSRKSGACSKESWKHRTEFEGTFNYYQTYYAHICRELTGFVNSLNYIASNSLHVVILCYTVCIVAT